MRSSSGVTPCSPSRSASAIEKHEEWAAAASSSGLVLPSGRTVREPRVTPKPSSAVLLDAPSTPDPAVRDPLQVVCTLRSAMLMFLNVDPALGAPPGL
ncbi:hypothetical protein GCM10025869_07020 [Homoserinibacter gongjuensis]|uniref:Uncharacterized protein n=1 Tax=Homoserinibacter gongjuensis TaxID=1162968 RepID=A0ABQ6JQ34_9MICO|nr:hypothetical protein GCM10025869_07020 [Homoserinibacter gongjuensis]